MADDPAAASFGHSLFFDSRFSSNGEVSCATCHQPERRFTDGLPKDAKVVNAIVPGMREGRAVRIAEGVSK